MSEVPVVFDFDKALWLFLSDEIEPTADNIETVAGRLGRNYYPALVYSLYCESMLWGLYGEAVARKVVPAAWSDAEFPMVQLKPDEWRELFDHAGYTVDGEAAERPTEPPTLWRGAHPGHENGWSWTEDREQAQWFADRPHHFGKGVLVTAVVEPLRLLARITQQRPGENEYVVDARGMDVRLA